MRIRSKVVLALIVNPNVGSMLDCRPTYSADLFAFEGRVSFQEC